MTEYEDRDEVVRRLTPTRIPDEVLTKAFGLAPWHTGSESSAHEVKPARKSSPHFEEQVTRKVHAGTLDITCPRCNLSLRDDAVTFEWQPTPGTIEIVLASGHTVTTRPGKRIQVLCHPDPLP